jgi:hypothetical protein
VTPAALSVGMSHDCGASVCASLWIRVFGPGFGSPLCWPAPAMPVWLRAHRPSQHGQPGMSLQCKQWCGAVVWWLVLVWAPCNGTLCVCVCGLRALHRGTAQELCFHVLALTAWRLSAVECGRSTRRGNTLACQSRVHIRAWLQCEASAGCTNAVAHCHLPYVDLLMLHQCRE